MTAEWVAYEWDVLPILLRWQKMVRLSRPWSMGRRSADGGAVLLREPRIRCEHKHGLDSDQAACEAMGAPQCAFYGYYALLGDGQIWHGFFQDFCKSHADYTHLFKHAAGEGYGDFFGDAVAQPEFTTHKQDKVGQVGGSLMQNADCDRVSIFSGGGHEWGQRGEIRPGDKIAHIHEFFKGVSAPLGGYPLEDGARFAVIVSA